MSKADKEKIENRLKAININISQVEAMYKQLETERKISIPYKKFKNNFELTLDNLDNFKNLIEKMLELMKK